MKLHSIDIEKKTAIIDHQGQLIEVEWWLENNKIVYFEEKSWDKLSHSGLDPLDALNLIRNHLASAPKPKPHINLGNEMQEAMESALRGCGVNDNIENPSHYQILPGVEVINVRRALIDKIPSGTDLNAVDEWSRAWEYLTRMWGKNGLEDAKKARVYLNWLIERMEGVQ